jgi:hypothetical protein
MTYSLPGKSCAEVARLVAERGFALKTRGHENICSGIQWKVMDEKSRASVANQRARLASFGKSERMRTDHSCNSILQGALANDVVFCLPLRVAGGRSGRDGVSDARSDRARLREI